MGHHLDPDQVNSGNRPELRYEYRDVDAPKIWKTTFLFFFFTAVTVLVVIPMYWYAAGNASWSKWGVSNRDERVGKIPQQPYPMLQTDQQVKTDIRDHRMAEAKKTGEFGWLDKNSGKAHIPIDEAIKKVAASGLEAKGH
jgi:hypothetical protein